MSKPFALTVALPHGRATTAPCLSVRHAVLTIRALAARLGVSPMALDWSVAPARAEA